MMGTVWSVSFVLFMLAYFLVISPQMKAKARLERELTEKQRLHEAAVNVAKEEYKKKLNEELERLKGTLGDFVVESEQLADLTFDISRIAADKRVSAFTVRAADTSRNLGELDSNYLQENGIEVSFESDFRKFATFLNALERHRPVIFIDNFRVSRADRGEAASTVNMGLSVFVRKRPQG